MITRTVASDTTLTVDGITVPAGTSSREYADTLGIAIAQMFVMNGWWSPTVPDPTWQATIPDSAHAGQTIPNPTPQGQVTNPIKLGDAVNQQEEIWLTSLLRSWSKQQIQAAAQSTSDPGAQAIAVANAVAADTALNAALAAITPV